MLHPTLLAVLLAVLLAAVPSADVLPPGSAWVDHRIEILDLEDAPGGTTFFLFPHHLSNPPKVLAPGEAVSFYKHNSPRLFATTGEVPAEAPEDVDWDEAFLDAPGIAHSDVRLHRVSSVPKLQQTRSIHTTYRFLGIEDGVVRLELVSEVRRDAFGKEVPAGSVARWPFLLAVSAVGLFGLLGVVVVRRVRGRAAA